VDDCHVFNIGRRTYDATIIFQLMYFVTAATYNPSVHAIGGKAAGLYRLQKLGLTVPQWIVIPQQVLADMLPAELKGRDETCKYIASCSMPAEFVSAILKEFPADTLLAVRSSATDEDGTDFSFAGQFDSFLYVRKENLVDKIKQVWQSAFSERVEQYRTNHQLQHNTGIAVIVQQMIDAEVSGVAFGMNPVTGNRDEKIINSVYGLGEGLVQGELDADHFIVNNRTITKTLADKTHQYIINQQYGRGTVKAETDKTKIKNPSLTDQQIHELVAALDTCSKEFGQPQDIEFAIANNKIYFLQSRAVTGISTTAAKTGEYIVWDNSNIIESYPGVTTPLTFSFISKSYEGAYKLFSRYMGVSEQTIKEHEKIYANTLGLMNGRVYYNLKTWYHMLALLPGYSINARYMEQMMGVKERFDIPDSYRLSKTAAWWSIAKMAVNMYRRLLSLPAKRKEFVRLLDTTIAKYKQINYADKNANELMNLFLELEKTLLNEWKAPLLNDFFAMIWFGLLKKQCEKNEISNYNANIHNDLLCGSSDIISTQPIHRTIEITTAITKNQLWNELFEKNNELQIWQQLNTTTNPLLIELKGKIDAYIFDFGERCVGELKLESISYTQQPSRFISVLKSYLESGIIAETISGKTEELLRANAEQEVKKALKGKPIKQFVLNHIVKRTRELVSARENLRYERTRAFGIVREIFIQIGKRFHADKIINEPRDIFYVTRDEIFSFIEGRSVTQNIQQLIELRKKEFEVYRNQQPTAERFATYGTVYYANDFFSTAKIEQPEGNLKGIGCCPGRVQAKVRVVLNPQEINSLNGDILVTTSTDPGWVTLFPSATGIIVERGSLLSHSAIVSREMGKPCIVSVTGLLKTLNTGDEIIMDGSTGEITIISKAS
jgi:rifampicin phosphotransferase